MASHFVAFLSAVCFLSHHCLEVRAIHVRGGLRGSNAKQDESATSPVAETKSVVYINTNAWYPSKDIAASLCVPGFSASDKGYENCSRGYNVINLAFWTTGGPVDTAKVWSGLFHYFTKNNDFECTTNKECQKILIDKYHEAGMKLLVSAFGETDKPVSQGADAEAVAQELADFVTTNQLDGVDLDFEDKDAMENGVAEKWLITITKELRKKLGPDAIITHAPQGPYFFMGKEKYPGGGYTRVNKEVGDSINWYNIQFYNQDTTRYDTYEELFVKASGWAGKTAVQELKEGGLAMNKIVVGKPITRADADNTGYIPQSDLVDIFRKAKTNLGWTTGFMGWQVGSDKDGKWGSALNDALGA